MVKVVVWVVCPRRLRKMENSVYFGEKFQIKPAVSALVCADLEQNETVAHSAQAVSDAPGAAQLSAPDAGVC